MFLSDRDILKRLTNYYEIVGLKCSFDEALDFIKQGLMPDWLKKVIEGGAIIIDPFFDKEELNRRLGSWSLDLDLGPTIFIPPFSGEFGLIGGAIGKKRYNLNTLMSQPNSVGQIDISEHPYILEPHEFILGTTKQKIMLPPDVGAFINARSRVARVGISSVGAPLIDAGFCGWLALEIGNAGHNAIELEYGSTICQMSFCQLSSPAQRPYYDKQGTFIGKKIL